MSNLKHFLVTAGFLSAVGAGFTGMLALVLTVTAG